MNSTLDNKQGVPSMASAGSVPDWASRVASLRHAVAENHQDGASQIAVAALTGLLQLAADFEPSPRLRDNLIALAEELSGCRPAMAPVRNLIGDWLEAMAAIDPEPANDWLEASYGVGERLQDDSLVNKAGTCLLARTAAAHGVPFLALAERLKCSGDLEFSPEPHDPAALGVPDAPNLSAKNLTFDRTPPGLISAWLDEIGLAVNTAPAVAWPQSLEHRAGQRSQTRI